MKRVSKLFLLIVLASTFNGCKMDYFPTDELTGESLLKDEKGITYIMDGCYAVLKDQVEYLGYASGNDYCRHYFQMTEFTSDNICLSSRTPDPLYQALSYTMTDDLKNVGTLWMLAYKVIAMCNTVIETVDGNSSLKAKSSALQIQGEAYFMRALMHLHMVTLYAKPYTFGKDNLGVPLRLSANQPVTRATVGEVYTQIEKDLKKAAELMGESRGNAGYPSHDAALALLSRVYLYMGAYDKVLDVVNNQLGVPGDAIDAKLEPYGTFDTYFANTKTSKETLFCIGHETTDNKGQASLGSMYNGAGGGWGEIYPSNTLLYLYERYPEDLRYAAYIVPQYPAKATEDMYIYFPDPNSPDDKQGRQTLAVKLEKDELGYFIEDDYSQKCYANEKELAGGYTEWHITYDGEDCLARVHKQMKTRTSDFNPQWFVTKFANQNGMPQLCSPTFLRWSEVVLNRAEAEAKTSGMEAAALADVNRIRERAGIRKEGMFNSVSDHGYDNALDIVLDERRLELAFEGHRTFDMMRNERDMDRRFPGANPWEVVPYNRIQLQYPIPFSEWSVSGIAQNPGY